MNTFNPINSKDMPSLGLQSSQSSAASAGRGATRSDGTAVRQDISVSQDIADRIAQSARQSLPMTYELLDGIAQDVSRLESLRSGALQGEKASQSPGFDPAGVAAALEILQFTTEQAQAYGEKMRALMPSLDNVQSLTLDRIAAAPGQYQKQFVAVRKEASAAMERLAALTEDLAARNQRITARSGTSSAPDASGAAASVASAMQSENARSLQALRVPGSGAGQVARLLGDLGLTGSVRSSVSAVETSSGNARSSIPVVNLVNQLQKRLGD
jgi:hypothetical protein